MEEKRYMKNEEEEEGNDNAKEENVFSWFVKNGFRKKSVTLIRRLWNTIGDVAMDDT